MKMITHKIFYIGLLICLVSLTNKVSAQFVPMQSAQYKHLAADTLYDFTGNGAPTVHPRSYKRVVTYFDSTNGIPYWHNPKTQTWVTVSGGGGPIDSADYANLNFGYGFIIFDENPYNPATGAKAVALDTALINRYIDSVIATDTTISQNVGVFDYVVDTVSNSEPSEPDGYKYLAGTSSPNANKIGTKVGGVYTYVTPTANQSLEVRNQTQLLFYKYDGANWHLISIGDLIGGISGIYQPDIGTRDSNSFTIKTKNIPAIRIDEAQDVYLPKFIGIPSNNFAKFDTITGKFTYDVFHPFSLTTTGTSGPATFDAQTGILNVPQYSGGGGSDGNFAITDLTATGDRVHDFDGHSLAINNLSSFLSNSTDGSNTGIIGVTPTTAGVSNTTDAIALSVSTSLTENKAEISAYGLVEGDNRHYIDVYKDSILITSGLSTRLIMQRLPQGSTSDSMLSITTGGVIQKVVRPTSGGSGTTSYQTITSTGGQTAFTFTSVPASYNDYWIDRNGAVVNQEYYTTSSNTITFTGGMVSGDKIGFHRIK